MKRRLKVLSVIFAAALVAAGSGLSYCDEGAQVTREFGGQVMEVDWVGSLLTVGGMEEMTFFVPPGTKIIYGPETISLSDIDQDDYVVIRYIDNPSGMPKATRITVNKNYPLF